MLIPTNTSLAVQRVGDESHITFISEVLGPHRYGLCLTVPRLYNQYYPMVTGSEMICQYVDKGRLWQFQTYVMGYEQTVPPRMVVAEPGGIEEANRRMTLRFRTDLSVHYLVEGPLLAGERTRTVDLSLGGLCIVTSRLLEPHTRMALTLELPEITFQSDGVVRWSAFKGKTALAGVRFDGIRGQGEAALHKFLVSMEREWAKIRMS